MPILLPAAKQALFEMHDPPLPNLDYQEYSVSIGQQVWYGMALLLAWNYGPLLPVPR